jgi:hypothetical protein
MTPVFEDGPVLYLKLIEQLPLVLGMTGPEGVVMRSLDYRDGIDLDIAKLIDNLQDAIFPGVDFGIIIQKLSLYCQGSGHIFRDDYRFHFSVLPSLNK